tara:strand:+ start:760 stop:2058 length:1299 start_codon:yes stop_codon:yes gene_type:complete
MKKIKSFIIDTSALHEGPITRGYTISGDSGAVFSVIVQNEDGHFYNFPENTVVSEEEGVFTPSGSFSATTSGLFQKSIGKNGTYEGVISFPSISDDDYYQITIIADNSHDTEFDEKMSLDKLVYYSPRINQYTNTTLTFSLSSTLQDAGDESYGTYPSNYTTTGLSTSYSAANIKTSFSISWALALNDNDFIIARQPRINDFYFTTTKDTLTAGTGTSLELKNIEGLSVGMGVSGTGIAGGATITKIIKGYKDENKSTAAKAVYVIPKALSSDGLTMIDSIGGTVVISASSTFVADRTLTFTGYGFGGASEFNSTKFTISNLKVVINPVTTTTDAVVSNSTTIPITSTNGIRAVDTVLMTGVGVTAASPHVDTVNAGVSVVVSAAQTIENGQTVVFTGSSRAATVTGDVEIQRHGKDNLTLTLELDNILTVS